MKTPEEQQLAEEQIKEIQIEYLYRIADFSKKCKIYSHRLLISQ